MNQSTNYQHWCRLVKDAIPLKMSDSAAIALYHRAASAYALGDSYTCQVGPEQIDLTELFAQSILLNKLTADYK